MAAGDHSAAVGERLWACAPIMVMVLDAEGRIIWVDGAVESISGYRPEEVLGTSVFGFIDTSWNPIALDSISAALAGNGLQRPMQFRLVRKDGSTFVGEVQANSQWNDPTLKGMAVYVRRWDERMLLDEIIDNLAAGAPVNETLSLLCKVMSAETLDGDGVVLLDVGSDRCMRSVCARDLPSELSTDDGLGGTPWRRALSVESPVSMRTEDLPASIRHSAQAAGYRYCWAWPVAGAAGIAGCLVLWRKADEEPDHTCRMALENLVRVTGLVLDRELQLAEVRHAASHDPLTELANRSRFFSHLESSLDTGGPFVGVLYVDLDDFKPVNDRFGHHVGDQVLQTVGRRLMAEVRQNDLVARLGGDEFAIVCDAVSSVETLESMAERLTASLREPIAIGKEKIQVGVSVGIAFAAPGTCSTDALLEAADAAMYSAKENHRGSWRSVEASQITDTGGSAQRE